MIIVKPIDTYACEILSQAENGAITLPYSSREEFENVLGRTKKFENGALTDMTQEEITLRDGNRLRCKRKYLLEAFDKWEKAVLRGRETDDSMIMLWYQMLLDLNAAAFDSVPERIKYYLR